MWKTALCMTIVSKTIIINRHLLTEQKVCRLYSDSNYVDWIRIFIKFDI